MALAASVIGFPLKAPTLLARRVPAFTMMVNVFAALKTKVPVSFASFKVKALNRCCRRLSRK